MSLGKDAQKPPKFLETIFIQAFVELFGEKTVGRKSRTYSFKNTYNLRNICLMLQ
jgi:hypothetical protein